jgi:hypothetical protein
MKTFAAALMSAHEARVAFECTCATNMGMYVCSETSVSTVAMCMKSFLMYNGVIEAAATPKGIYLNHLYGILMGMCVNLYQVSACRFGRQHMAWLFGPNAIHLPTSQAHIDAERTNMNLILICVYLDYI